jgi:hypothetical protein
MLLHLTSSYTNSRFWAASYFVYTTCFITIMETPAYLNNYRYQFVCVRYYEPHKTTQGDYKNRTTGTFFYPIFSLEMWYKMIPEMINTFMHTKSKEICIFETVFIIIVLKILFAIPAAQNWMVSMQEPQSPLLIKLTARTCLDEPQAKSHLKLPSISWSPSFTKCV